MVNTKKSIELPVTVKMHQETRSELKSDIASVSIKVDAVNKKVDALKAEMKSDIAEVRSDIKQVLAAVHRVTALVEEQDNRNKYALDGYAALNARMDRLEKPEV